MRLALVLLLLSAGPPLTQEERVSAKRLAALKSLEKLRNKLEGIPRAELLYRSALLLEEEAASKATPELAEPFRKQERELLEELLDETSSSPHAPDARERLSALTKPPVGARLSLDEVMHAARAEFEEEAPLAVPAGMKISLTCCVQTNVLEDPVGVVITLLLPAFPDEPGADRPTTSLGGYSVSVVGEAKVLRRPDFVQLRGTLVAMAAAAQRAVTIAHEKLMKLEAAAAWRARGGGYSTSLVAAGGQLWTVYFRAPDQSFQMTVDLKRGVVTQASVGAAATPLP